MKKEGFKYLCKVCPDGRLYNGAWYHISFLPEPLPNELVFEEFPEQGQPEIGPAASCSDYIWNGEKLIYSPAQKPDAETESEGLV